MPYSYDGVDLNDGTTYKITMDRSRPHAGGERSHFVTPWLDRPGGIVTPRPPGPATKVLGGWLKHASNWETQRDELNEVLSRPRRRLVCSELDSRWTIATPMRWEFEHVTQRTGFWQCEFVLEDYLAAEIPTVFEATGAPSASPYGGNNYYRRLTPTVAGSVPTAPLWNIINPAAGVTPNDWTFSNVSIHPNERLWIDGNVAASTMLTVDPDNGMVYATPLSNLLLYMPMEGSGGTTDYSGNGAVFFASGGVSGGAEGVIGQGMAFNGSSQLIGSSDSDLGVTGAFTLCGWVKLQSAISATAGFFGKMSSNAGYHIGASTSAWILRKGTGGGQQTATSSFASGAQQTAIKPDVGKWIFLCGSHHGTNGMKLWVGDRDHPPLLEGFNSNTSAPTAGTNNFSIGGAHDAAGTLHYGHIVADEVALYNVELSAQQVYDVWRYGPFAYSRTNLIRRGQYPRLYPRISGVAQSSNVMELGVNAGSSPATYTILGRYRSRYE